MYKFEDVFTSSQEYASRFAGKVGQWLLSVQDKALLEVLESRVRPGGLLLDVGGGHGQLSGLTKSLGKELVVSVSHFDAIRNLRQRQVLFKVKQEQGVVSDLFSLPYKNQSFPVVSSVRLLSHCEDWERLVAELCRVSADLVVVDYPPLLSSNVLYKLLFPLKKFIEGNTRSFKIFSHKEVEMAFESQGFQRQAIVGQFFWPMVLHRKLKSVALSKALEGIASGLGMVGLFGNPSIVLFARKPFAKIE